MSYTHLRACAFTTARERSRRIRVRPSLQRPRVFLCRIDQQSRHGRRHVGRCSRDQRRASRRPFSCRRGAYSNCGKPLDTRNQTNSCALSRDMAYEMFGTTHSPELGGRVYFGDAGDVVSCSRDSANSGALAVYVINPYLGVFNQLLRLNPSLIQGHGEVDLK